MTERIVTAEVPDLDLFAHGFGWPEIRAMLRARVTTTADVAALGETDPVRAENWLIAYRELVAATADVAGIAGIDLGGGLFEARQWNRLAAYLCASAPRYWDGSRQGKDYIYGVRGVWIWGSLAAATIRLIEATPWGPHGAAFVGTSRAPGASVSWRRVEVNSRLVLWASETSGRLFVADADSAEAARQALRDRRRASHAEYEDLLGRCARAIRENRIVEPADMVGWIYRDGQEGGYFFRHRDRTGPRSAVSAPGAFRRAGVAP